ncbi:MAG: hypothetical protein K0R14_2146 [Burkholderiales bacterium]|jgi:hypothetical protein|nr:hypothetical protein [Burkholderiales bacterium]
MSFPIDKFPDINICNYSSIRGELKSGDILLASGSAVFSKLIQQVTRSIWSHVAFILRAKQLTKENIHGPFTDSLDAYFKDKAHSTILGLLQNHL